MKQVRISELKDNLSRHLRRVEAGECIEILDRARPIARVIPPLGDEPLEIRPATRSFASVRGRRFPPARLKISSLEMLRLERGER